MTETPPEAPRGAKQAAVGGAMFLGAASLVQAVLQLGVVAILARLLTPGDFGRMAAALIVVDLANNLAQMGIGQAIVRKADLDDAYIRVAFTLSMAMGAMMALVVLLCAHPIAVVLGSPNVTPLIQAISISIVLSSASITGQYLLVKRLDTRSMAARKLLGYVVGYGVVGVVSAFFGAGAWALVFATIADAATRAVLVWLRTRHPMKPLYSRAIAHELLMFGGGVSFGRVLNAISGQADRSIVANIFGPLMLGLYTRAYQLMRFPGQILGNVIDDIALPSFVLIGSDRQRMYGAIAQSIAIVSLLLGPTAALVCFYADEIVRILLGSQWTAAVPILVVLSLGMPFRPMQRIMVAAALADGLAWRSSVRQAVGLLVFAICVVIGAKTGGLIGAAWGVALGLILQVVILGLGCIGLNLGAWGMVGAAMLRAVPLTLAVSAPAVAVKLFDATVGSPSAVTLIGGLALSGLSAVVAVMVAPGLFLGAEGKGMVRQIMKKFPAKVRSHAVVAKILAKF